MRARALRAFWMNSILGSALVHYKVRFLGLRAMGLQIEPCRIEPTVSFANDKISIGYGTYVNRGTHIEGSAMTAIGQKCSIGQNVTIANTTHEIGPRDRRAGVGQVKPVSIDDGVWIGAAATILPGVSIGAGCVVAAGAVVTRNCAPDGVYAGVPARRIRDLDGSAHHETTVSRASTTCTTVGSDASDPAAGPIS